MKAAWDAEDDARKAREKFDQDLEAALAVCEYEDPVEDSANPTTNGRLSVPPASTNFNADNDKGDAVSEEQQTAERALSTAPQNSNLMLIIRSFEVCAA